MTIYYVLISCLTFIHMNIICLYFQYNKSNWKLIESMLLGGTLFFVMALRNESVGIDTIQYIYRYNNVRYPLDLNIFLYPEWLFHGFASLLKNLNIPNQMYIAIIALIIAIMFSLFYYKYSNNIYYSHYLHVTIGIFSLSLSGLRQTIAIGIFLIAFDYLFYKKPFRFIISIVIASFIHQSAILLLPIYLFHNWKFSKKNGFVILLFFLSIVIFVNPLLGYMVPFLPSKYVYYIINNSNSINPLVIAVSVSIPLFYLLFSKKENNLNLFSNRLYSLFFLMTAFNVLFNILALNVSMISRLSFYFLPFSMILIPLTLSEIKDKGIRTLFFLLITFLCFLQFLISTPDGVLQIDNYKFFWQ